MDEEQIELLKKALELYAFTIQQRVASLAPPRLTNP